MALSKEFENAKSNLELLKSDPGNDAKLKLYAFYKQASIGNCNTTKPNFTDLVNKYKWNAWNNLKNMSKVKNYFKI
jgi:peroxisomal 3,2-trans-enoyl-CoA isomerase